MASDRTYEFNGQKGHWYTDDQGNRYFVAQGQTPKEGWEATKRRKMIKGGKYVKDDGDDKGEQEISANEYQTYEADEEERFDETTDADFEDPEPEGFDRDDDKDISSWENTQEMWKLRKNGMSDEEIVKHFVDKGFDEKSVRAEVDYMDADDESEQEQDPPEGFVKFDGYLNDPYQPIKEGMQVVSKDGTTYYVTSVDPMDDNYLWVSENEADVQSGRGNSLHKSDIAFVSDNMKEDGTNGWKPSEEATPAYDVGGFYSINEGDRWEFEDGGSIEVRDVDGNYVAVVTPNGTKRMTKDELSDMVKNAVKVPGKGKSKADDREIPWTAGEIEDEDNAEYLKGKSGPQTANIDANVNDIAKEVASKFGEANVKVNEDGHILLKDPEGFDPVAIADEDEIPAGAIVKIMPNWREPNENPDDTYFVKEDRGNRLLLWSPSKSSSFGGYTYEWPKNTMYIPPRMRGGNPNSTEGKQGPAEKQGSKSTVDEAFEYAKGLFDDPKTRDKAINMMVEKYPNASDDEIGQAVTKLISYWKGKR